MRFASKKYQNSDLASQEAKYTHLTNYSINKKNEAFVENQDATEGDSGFKWSMTAFCQHLEELGVDTAHMWAKIYDIVIKSLLCIES